VLVAGAQHDPLRVPELPARSVAAEDVVAGAVRKSLVDSTIAFSRE